MAKKCILLTASLLLALFLPRLMHGQKDGFSKVMDETSFRQKMVEITNETNAISSNFVQEKQLSFMEEPIVSEGQFFFRKDQKIRWEYESPFKYLVILKGSELLINDEGHINEIDLKNNKTFQEVNATINNSLQGNVWGDTKDFAPTLYQNNTQFLIQLMPLTDQMKSYLTKIEVLFNKDDYQLEEVIMYESGGDFTKISFLNRTINPSIPDAVFEL